VNQIAQQQRSAGITGEAREAMQKFFTAFSSGRRKIAAKSSFAASKLESRAFWLARMRNMPDYLNS